jgi:rhodanese-related sulfurtransferase
MGVLLVECSSQAGTGAISTTSIQPTMPSATTMPAASPAADLLPEEQVLTLFSNLMDSIQANQGYGYVQPEALKAGLASETQPFLLDVRDPGELNQDGFILGAVNIPLRTLLRNLDKLPAQDADMVIYSHDGYQSGMALVALKLLGYTNVHDLAGGFSSWVHSSKYPIVTGVEPAAPTELTPYPVITDQGIYAMLDAYLSNLPDDYYEIDPLTLSGQLSSSTPPTIIDMNTDQDHSQYGVIKGSLNIPYSDFFKHIDELPSKDTPIVIYAIGGGHSSVLLMGLREMGYTNVFNLKGGILGWKNAGLPVETGSGN